MIGIRTPLRPLTPLTPLLGKVARIHFETNSVEHPLSVMTISTISSIAAIQLSKQRPRLREHQHILSKLLLGAFVHLKFTLRTVIRGSSMRPVVLVFNAFNVETNYLCEKNQLSKAYEFFSCRFHRCRQCGIRLREHKATKCAFYRVWT